jgi:hypothetical protein
MLGGMTIFAFAQVKTPVVEHATPNPVSQSNAIGTPTRPFFTQIRNALHAINIGVSSGKLSKDEAQILRGKVRAIHIQEMMFMKENGKRELNHNQINQLNQELNDIVSSI